MKRLRLSILSLALVVVTFALAFTALRTASALWTSTLYTFTMGMLLMAVIAARFRRGNEKAFWFGFAVFGWAVFIVGLGPWPNPYRSARGGIGIALNPHLLTSELILFLVPYLRTETNDLEAIEQITSNTIAIAHLLVTLATAIGGGVIALLIKKRRGPLVSLKSLTTLAVASVATVFFSSSFFARSPTPFFPPSESSDDDQKISWFPKYLKAMGEPSLWTLSQQNPAATVYRLLWLPTFHHPVCVRIDRTRPQVTLHVTVLDGKGGYEPGRIAIERTMALRRDEVEDLDRFLVQTAFWNMPTDEQIGAMIADGDYLIVEGVKGGEYHLVSRADPTKAYRDLCQRVLDLSGLKYQENWRGYHEVSLDNPPKK